MKRFLALILSASLLAGCAATATVNTAPPSGVSSVVTEAKTVEAAVSAGIPVIQAVLSELSSSAAISAADYTAATNWLTAVSTANASAIAITNAAGASGTSVLAALQSVVTAIGAQPQLVSVTDAASVAKLQAAIAVVTAVVALVTALQSAS